MALEVQNSPEVGLEGEIGGDLEVGAEGTTLDNTEKQANFLSTMEEEFSVTIEEGLSPNISKLLFDKGNGEDSRDALVSLLKGQGMDVSVPNNSVTTLEFGDTQYTVEDWTRPDGPPASAAPLVKVLVANGIRVNGRNGEGEKRSLSS